MLPPSDQPTTEAPTYAWRALDRFDRFAEAEALVLDDRRLTYAELAAGVRGMANALWQHGIRPGSAVGVAAYNPVESILLQLALHLFGCRSAWVAPNAPAAFRRDFVRRAGVGTFVYDARTLPELGEELSTGLTVLCYGDGVGPNLAAAPPASDLPLRPSEVTGEPDSLFQTGGTTAQPKLVHHRERFFAALLPLADAYAASGAPRLRHLQMFGTWHVSSQTAAFLTLFSGGTLVLNDGYAVGPFLELVERERITSAQLSPPQLYQVLDDPRQTTADLSSLHMLTVSGSPAAPSRLAEAIERFGPVLRIVYGMSESPFITALPNLDHDPARPDRLSSCGPPYLGVSVAVRSVVDGVPCPTGTAGEVWVSGPLVMAGYWEDPEQTAESMRDGWLRTGDIGYLDDEGYLYLVDRAKDMIVTGFGSANVYSRPVESALLGDPRVRSAAVVGVPDAAVGEVVHAFVVTTPGIRIDPTELRARVVSELNDLWAPRAITFVDELPLTGSGKVDKKALRAMYRSDLARDLPGKPL